jgi:hypothetical protein
MFDSVSSRPAGRLFTYMACIIFVLLPLRAIAAPATTIVSDVIYRADGTPAAGTLLISWPAFSTADTQAITAGSMSVPIGPFGAVTLALAPNQGATPAGTYYQIVLRLDDGTSTTEYWSIPTNSPVKIAMVRSVVVPQAVAVQNASRQYVDIALAAKASDTVVVHKAGDEQIAGVKQFAASPLVPSPASDSAVANKSYVDSVAIGSLSGYVNKGGDNMTGPLTLSGDPVNSNHASNRHYVDIQVASLSAGLGQKLNRSGDTPVMLGGIRFADAFPGADMCAKIAAAIADLPSAGGTIDARGFSGTETCATTITVNKPAKLLLGAVKISSSATGAAVSITSNGVTIEGVEAYPSDTLAGTQISTTNDNADVIKVDATAATIQDFSITNLYLKGKATGATGHGLHVDATTNTVYSFQVRNVWINSAKQNGIYLEAGAGGGGYIFDADFYNVRTIYNTNGFVALGRVMEIALYSPYSDLNTVNDFSVDGGVAAEAQSITFNSPRAGSAAVGFNLKNVTGFWIHNIYTESITGTQVALHSARRGIIKGGQIKQAGDAYGITFDSLIFPTDTVEIDVPGWTNISTKKRLHYVGGSTIALWLGRCAGGPFTSADQDGAWFPNISELKFPVSKDATGVIDVAGYKQGGVALECSPVFTAKDGRCYSGDWGQKLTACLADLPATGGTCDMRGITGTQSLSSALTLNKSNVAILLGAPLTVNMGTNSLIIPSGIYNLAMYGPIPWGGNASSGAPQSTSFAYSGNPGTAFLIGDDSGDVRHLYLANFNLRVWYDPSSGINLTRVHNSSFDHVFVALNTANTATGTQMYVDGASGYNDTITWNEYKGFGGKYGIVIRGTAEPPGNAAFVFKGGYIGTNGKTTAGSICLDIEGTDTLSTHGLNVQKCDIGAKVASSNNNFTYLRVEVPDVNTSVWFTSTAKRNYLSTTAWARVQDDQTDPEQRNLTFRPGSIGMSPDGLATFNVGVSAGGLATTQLATPLAPAVTPTGGAAGTYTYKTVAVSPYGGTSAASAATTIGNGPTSLDATHYNTINVNYVYGATSIDVYRTAGGATQGKISSIPVTLTNEGGNVTSLFQVVDNGLAGDSATPPVTNTTGVISATSYKQGGSALASTHLSDSSGLSRNLADKDSDCKMPNGVVCASYTGSASMGATTIYTPSVDGTYRVTVMQYFSAVDAGNSGTIQPQITYGTGYATNTTGCGTTAQTTTSLFTVTQGTCTFHVGASQPIKFATIFSSFSGTVTWKTDVIVEQLQ